MLIAVCFVYTCRRLIDLCLLCIHMPAIDRSLSSQVLPASRRVIGARALEAASAQADVRLALAVISWLSVLFFVGPVYVMTWHSWQYSEAVWYTYTTMTGIGYGDLYPNSHDTDFSVTVLNDLENAENDHPVYIWCQAVFIIFFFVAVFSFGFAAVGDVRRERREMHIARSLEARGAAYSTQPHIPMPNMPSSVRGRHSSFVSSRSHRSLGDESEAGSPRDAADGAQAGKLEIIGHFSIETRHFSGAIPHELCISNAHTRSDPLSQRDPSGAQVYLYVNLASLKNGWCYRRCVSVVARWGSEARTGGEAQGERPPAEAAQQQRAKPR